MIVFYLAAGANHFINPQFYLKIMPPWLAWHQQLVYLSGLLEILFALLLIFVPTRRIAAWGIIALLVAVFPANIQMMLDYWYEGNRWTWLTIVRLPIQFILIWWAYGFTKPLLEKKNSSII